jgi:uncharacterized protein YndB with AHSA1/START domain
MSTSKTAARAIADVGTGTILATVEIAATPERVFRALTTDDITRWWGSPETYRTTAYTADVRPGGRWRSARAARRSPRRGGFARSTPPRTIGGAWGLGVVRAPSEAAVHALRDGDPVIREGRGFRYEIAPMLKAVLPARD